LENKIKAQASSLRLQGQHHSQNVVGAPIAQVPAAKPEEMKSLQALALNLFNLSEK